MRWQHLLGFAAVIMTALALFTLPGSTTPIATANDVAVDAQSSFKLRLELSQTQRTLAINLIDGEAFAPGALEITLTHCTATGAQQTTFNLFGLQLDAFGNYQLILPLQFDPTVTNFEVHLTAYHLSLGVPVYVNTPWQFGSMLVNDFTDVAAISQTASDAITAVGGDIAVDVSSGSGSGSTSSTDEGVTATFAFASQMTAADGSFVLTGPGIYMAAGPPAQFSVTSGPTGVFTAN